MTNHHPQQPGGPWTPGPHPATPPSNPEPISPPFAGPPPGPTTHQPWPTSPSFAPSFVPPVAASAARARWTGGLMLAAAAAAVVLIGASVGITLSLDQHSGSATPVAAHHSPATGGAAGDAPAPGGATSAAALVSSYVKAENAGQGDTMERLLCGATGPAADSAKEYSWTFIALHEQVTPGQLGAAATGQQVTLAISYHGQPSGEYAALLAQHGSRWCVQTVVNGPSTGSGP